MQAFSWVRRLLQSERGNVIVLGATTLPMVIGAAAIGIDTIQLSLWKRQLQRAADSAAMAGAHALAQSKDAVAAADRDLQLNNQLPLLAGRQVQPPPTSGPFAGDTRAVRVVITSRQTLPFWSFFTNESPTLTAEATARIVPDGEFCMYADEDGTTPGITVGGSGQLNLGCGMATNSIASNAVALSGSATVIATPITAPGGLSPSTRYVPPTELNPYSTKLTDPLASLANPTLPSSCLPKYSQGPNEAPPTITMPASKVICFNGMDIKGTVTLPPGTYMINGDAFRAGAQANITCLGCTFVLTSSTAATDPASVATLDIGAGAQLTLEATKQGGGEYAGVLFYQDRRATLLNAITFNGSAAGRLQGAIYLPRANLNWNGGAAMVTTCLQFITRRLNFSGNAYVDNNCPADSGVRDLRANYVRLVG
jgi:Flp pilus assembly protein TadG